MSGPMPPLSPAAFEADLDPDTKRPRIRITFANGWTVSVVLRGQGPCDFPMASLATLYNRTVASLGEQEASPDEVGAYLARVMALHPWPEDEPPHEPSFLNHIGRYRK